jgi:hypothetical protein
LTAQNRARQQAGGKSPISDSASSVLIAAHSLLLRIWRALLLN